MPSLARKALTVWLLALHATVLLSGPCLHGLPGGNHANGLASAADHDHVREAGPSTHGRPHDCPICHFFSQAQLPVDVASLPAVRHVSALKAEPVREPATLSRLHPTSPRAPPSSDTPLS